MITDKRISLLEHGRIPSGKACPFTDKCGLITCSKRGPTDVSFSCDFAREFDICQKDTINEKIKSSDNNSSLVSNLLSIKSEIRDLMQRIQKYIPFEEPEINQRAEAIMEGFNSILNDLQKKSTN
jgi:hypothetical protein